MRSRKLNTSTANASKGDINISPLIDMVFILLIFFIVTTTFIEESGLAAGTPEPSAEPPDKDRERLMLHITESGQVFADYEGELTELGTGGIERRVRQAMGSDPYPLVLKNHPRTPVYLYTLVHDLCMSGGAQSVVLSLEEN